MDAGWLGLPGLTDLEWVAAGGHSNVYRARQPDLERAVAVKVISSADDGLKRRFDRERRAMGRLSAKMAT